MILKTLSIFKVNFLPRLGFPQSSSQGHQQICIFLHNLGLAKFSSQGHQKTFKKLWFCYIKACGTLASGAPSASLPRSGRSAPSLRPLRSVAPGARLARFGRSARSRIEPSARSLHGPWLWSSCCSLASLAHSTRSCSHGPCRSLAPRLYMRSLASRPPLARLAPFAPSLCGLRSVAPRPPLGALRALRSLENFN